MKTFMLILISVLSLAATKSKVKPTAATTALAAGQWHSEAHFKLNGIPMPPSDDKNCVTKEETKDVKKAIEESLARNDCKLITWVMKKETVDATVSCANDDFSADGTLKGTFSQKKYDLAGDIQGKHKLLGKARAHVKLTGEWIGECKQ
ncbi:MAG: DUF3617 family protein [Bdellovibrionaceae bacterium]|nr:DUF3617 family protein [Bdellovibrio sp.]